MGKRSSFCQAIGLVVLALCVAIPSAASTCSPPDKGALAVLGYFRVMRGEENLTTSGYSRSTECGDRTDIFERSALKSNLLFFATGAVNVAAEVPFGKDDHYSVVVSGSFAHVQLGNFYTLQTLQGGLDAKYWFDTKNGPLNGWSGGVYAVFSGPWDIQQGSGWQGNSFFSTGVSGGYSMPLNNYLNLEFVASAGLFHTPEARKYRPENGVLMWQQTRQNVNRFSITRLQVNLVWRIRGGKEEWRR